MAGGKREGKKHRENGWDGSGGYFLRVVKEEMTELSLRVEKLERAALCEGSGGSSGCGGNEWVWWNGTWWIMTKSRMNSASKRKVLRAVKQAMRQDDEKLKADVKNDGVFET